jgi:hypothetical protein
MGRISEKKNTIEVNGKTDLRRSQATREESRRLTFNLNGWREKSHLAYCNCSIELRNSSSSLSIH